MKVYCLSITFCISFEWSGKALNRQELANRDGASESGNRKLEAAGDVEKVEWNARRNKSPTLKNRGLGTQGRPIHLW